MALVATGLLPLALYGIVVLRSRLTRPPAAGGERAAARPDQAAEARPGASGAHASVHGLSTRARPAMPGPRLDPWLGLALLAHAGTLAMDWVWVFRFGFAHLLSAMVWIALLLVWMENRRVNLGRLPMLLAALAMPVVVLPEIFPGQTFVLDQQAPLFVPHLVVGTLAYGMVFMAALQALLMAAAEHRLHPRRHDRAGVLTTLLARGHQALPPLMVLERVLFQVIRVAFVLLLLTTASGVFFSEEIFGRPLPLNHKTVFSLVATVFFGLLLLGRRLWGWRGRLAIRLTLGGFILLLLSYVGSRFVLEVILQRI